MKKVHVQTTAPYDVLIGHHLLSECGERIRAQIGRSCKAAILTDNIVDCLYGQQVADSLHQSGFEICRHVTPNGESHKTLASWQEMLHFLCQNQLTRTDLVVALGGGVVGDMAGFAAASYLRGIPFVQIPTTLLAMVDSSIGGKTGVNLPTGKNLVGAFHQPSLVLCDTAVLKTVPPEVFADGVAEVLKYAVLGDEALFALLSEGKWQSEMLWVIETCVSMKARFVHRDERDLGARQLLNLGHTLGHAIETCSGYTVSHGHAVAVGMVYAARLSEKLGFCPASVVNRIKKALAANNLPIATSYSADSICTVVLSDKKRLGSHITFVLPHDIGQCEQMTFEVAELPKLVNLAVSG